MIKTSKILANLVVSGSRELIEVMIRIMARGTKWKFPLLWDNSDSTASCTIMLPN